MTHFWHHASSLFDWLSNMFNPPPRASMSTSQKIGRSVLITVTLLVICILFAMLGAAALFALEEGRRMIKNIPALAGDLGIIFVSVCVNVACVFVLLQIRNADRRLMAGHEQAIPPGKTAAAVCD